MSRNELIQALIRVIGVVILVGVILSIPAHVGACIYGIYTFVKFSIQNSFQFAWDTTPISAFFSSLITLLLAAILGYYLMCGGRWFADKASKE